jgi:hypothetical protein
MRFLVLEKRFVENSGWDGKFFGNEKSGGACGVAEFLF